MVLTLILYDYAMESDLKCNDTTEEGWLLPLCETQCVCVDDCHNSMSDMSNIGEITVRQHQPQPYGALRVLHM
jgi:hypothetical protein